MGWFWYLIFAVLTVIPLWQLCPRYRLPPWFAFFAVIPVGAIALMWIFAYRDKLTIPGIDS